MQPFLPYHLRAYVMVDIERENELNFNECRVQHRMNWNERFFLNEDFSPTHSWFGELDSFFHFVHCESSLLVVSILLRIPMLPVLHSNFVTSFKDIKPSTGGRIIISIDGNVYIHSKWVKCEVAASDVTAP